MKFTKALQADWNYRTPVEKAAIRLALSLVLLLLMTFGYVTFNNSSQRGGLAKILRDFPLEIANSEIELGEIAFSQEMINFLRSVFNMAPNNVPQVGDRATVSIDYVELPIAEGGSIEGAVGLTFELTINFAGTSTQRGFTAGIRFILHQFDDDWIQITSIDSVGTAVRPIPQAYYIAAHTFIIDLFASLNRNNSPQFPETTQDDLLYAVLEQARNGLPLPVVPWPTIQGGEA